MSTMTTIIFRMLMAGVILLLIYLRYVMQRKPFLELGAKLPGPKSIPILGDILTFAIDSTNSLYIGMDLVKKFNGGPIRFWFLHELVVFLIKPCDIEIVLSNMKQFKKPWQYNLLSPFMGKGLFTNDDYGTWRSHRKTITPAFHFNILKGFIPIFFEEASIFVKKIIPGKEMDVHQMTGLCALDIICRTALGVKVHSQSGKGKDFVNGMGTLLEIVHTRLVRPWLINNTIFSWSSLKPKHDKACNAVLQFTENVIKEKKNKKINKNVEGANDSEQRDTGTFLDMMLGDGIEHNLTDLQLRDETITIIIGGQETTTTEITFTLLMLALHLDIQQKVLEEIDAVFQGDKTTTTTYENLLQLEYTERVIKEVMRLYPSIPLYGRVLDEDINVNGYLLPKGVIAAVFIYGTHRDPKSYVNPEKFDPDNFLPERCRGRSPFSYLPFSAGPRNCIGQKYAILQIKTIISTIFRNYTVLPGGGIKCFDDVKVKMTSSIKSQKPVRLIFKPR